MSYFFNFNKIYFFIILAVLLILGLVLLRNRIFKIAIKTREKYSFVFLVHFAKYLFFYFFLFAGVIFVKFFDLPIEIKNFSKEIIFVLFVIGVSVPLIKFSDLFLGNILKEFGKDVASATIIKNVAKILLIALILIVILSSLKISILPVLTTLGIGGLTVAFAMKDILSNFFAGLYIISSKQLNVDDFVELETGEKGFITDITWRTIQLRLLTEKIILIPNAKFVEARITNHSLPTEEVFFNIPVSVHSENDLELIEKITLDVAKELLIKEAGAVNKFEPFVRYNKFDGCNINFSVILKSKNYQSQIFLTHEFIKKLHSRYQKENIKTAVSINIQAK
jgi:small-conductance mechanosensitive channel